MSAIRLAGLRRSLVILGASLPLTLGALGAYAQTIPPAQPAPNAAAQAKADGRLSDANLGVMLSNMGYEPRKTPGADGSTVYVVSVHHGGYDFDANICISSSKDYLWVDCAVGSFNSLEKTRKETLLALLAKNWENGVPKFSYRAEDKMFHLEMPLANHEITPAAMRDAMTMAFDQVVESQAIFKQDSPKEQTAQAPTAPGQQK